MKIILRQPAESIGIYDRSDRTCRKFSGIYKIQSIVLDRPVLPSAHSRRSHTIAEKLRIVQESLAPSVSVLIKKKAQLMHEAILSVRHVHSRSAVGRIGS